jgi:hypothetical protein
MLLSDPVIESLTATVDELLVCCEFLAVGGQGFAGNTGLNQGVEHRRESVKRQLLELNSAVALGQRGTGFDFDLDAAFNKLETVLDEFNAVFAASEVLRLAAEAEAAAPDGIKLVSQKTRRTYFQMKAAASTRTARAG